VNEAIDDPNGATTRCADHWFRKAGAGFRHARQRKGTWWKDYSCSRHTARRGLR
jgi:hypothetical protein